MIIRRQQSQEFDRKWETRLGFSYHDGPQIQAYTFMTQYMGEPKQDWLVSGYFVGFKIRDWRIEAFHTYYDGENCVWQFGPFVFGRFGTLTGCKKCHEDK